MERYDVEFAGGQSVCGDGAVNYMIVDVPGSDGEAVRLYAEETVPAGIEPDDVEAMAAVDCESYERLEAEIVRQAVEHAIDPKMLRFWMKD